VSKKTGRSKGAAILADVKRRERNRMILIQVAIGAVLVALIAGIGITLVIRKNDKDAAENRVPNVATAQMPGKTPDIKVNITRTDQGGIKIGKDDASVKIVAVEDFQCPACQQFEQLTGATLTELAQSGTASIEYRPISFLDSKSTTEYSSRASNAAWSVAEADVSKWLAMHKALYDQQPAEGSEGLSDDKLFELAKSAGAPDSVKDAITSGKFRGYVRQISQKNMVQATPTVTLNGRVLKGNELTPDGLKAAVAAATPK
jgi:protein-disulfide isomerase